jgi:hypothetical protein
VPYESACLTAGAGTVTAGSVRSANSGPPLSLNNNQLILNVFVEVSAIIFRASFGYPIGGEVYDTAKERQNGPGVAP